MEIPFEYKGEYEIPKGYQFFTQSESKLFMEGWQPKYSLEDGLQKYKDYLNGVV
jgi:nucleoside-diphosphate-sugar epimerase